MEQGGKRAGDEVDSLIEGMRCDVVGLVGEDKLDNVKFGELRPTS